MTFFRSIIGKLNTSIIVYFFELLRKIQISSKKRINRNNKLNFDTYKRHLAFIEESDGFIEDQNSYEDMLYGKTTMKYAGCEIFATFNAMFDICKRNIVSLPDMISEFEKDGMALSARFGTSPGAIVSYLKKHGFDAKLITREAEFDDLADKSKTLILTLFNDKNDILKQIHTINISKSGGKYTAHNVYGNGSVVGPYNSVIELINHINHGKAKGICLIGVNK